MAAIAMAILGQRILARPAEARRPTIPTSNDSTIRASESGAQASAQDDRALAGGRSAENNGDCPTVDTSTNGR
jgi:hypothetical protein